jgi:hypothetical protein
MSIVARHLRHTLPSWQYWMHMEVRRSAFLTFADCTQRDAAIRAVQEFNGSEMRGRRLKVSLVEENAPNATAMTVGMPFPQGMQQPAALAFPLLGNV